MWRPNVAESESLDNGAEAWCTEIKQNNTENHLSIFIPFVLYLMILSVAYVA
jgi:hypothetical protein